MLIIDAANVIGSRPDGWWRDRAGAAGRLVDTVVAAAVTGRLLQSVVVVLEGRARSGHPEGPAAVIEVDPATELTVTVVHASGDGDDAIVDEVRRTPGAASVIVITADRELRQRVEALGASVHGPSWLLGQLE